MPRIVRLAAVAVVLAVLGGVAAAAPKRKVKIESDPPGATVYVGDKAKGARGTTPVQLDLPVGEVTLILELDGYVTATESVTVEKAKGRRPTPQRVAIPLDKAVGVVRLRGMPEGATVTVDGNEVSFLDNRVELEPGAHELVVTAADKRRFDQWIEVSIGEDTVVKVNFEEPVVVVKPAKPHPHKRGGRPWYGTVAAGYEIGWRKFRYDSPQTTNLRPFDARGVGLLALSAELHPWRASPSAHGLWPLSIVVGYGLGLPVVATSPTGDTADTYWRTTEAGLRWRWNVTHTAALDFEAGWARLLYAFRGADGGLVDEIPDVDYETVRAALRAMIHAGPARVWVGVENRIVISGGVVQDRFTGAKAQGLGARLGGELPVAKGKVVLRLDGTFERYGWTFQSKAGDTFNAAGATDLVWGLTGSIGVAY
ncbi:MAG: PEGA domain-containing protein [Deltaproteobacteria bacterium]|nr:PEGA domain-containing protein [Deltaproteobacteria bacterium]